MMARLYSNENFPLPVVVELRQRGHDVLTSSDAGHANLALPDDEVLRCAVRDGRAVMTLNRRHFIRLHNNDSNHCGIIICKVDADYPGQAARIDEALTNCPDLSGQLIRI